MIETIINFIEGYDYTNKKVFLSFFKNIKKEKSFNFFLLDYKGDFNDDVIEEMDLLCKLLIDLDYIYKTEQKNNTNTFLILNSKINFEYETNYNFKGKNLKKNKLSEMPSYTFNRIETVLDENLSGESLSILKQFFKHLEKSAAITDMEKFELEFRPLNRKDKLIENEDVMDACVELARAGVIKKTDNRVGKVFFTIRNTNVKFSIEEVLFASVKKKDVKRKKNNSAKGINKPKPKPVKKVEPFIITDDELNERALSVINSALKNDKDGVIDIFEKISLPFNGENYKRQLFERIFELSKIKGEWRDDIGYVIFSKKRTKKAVVSHMDLISPFNRGFAKGKVYEIVDDKLVGALDNTFTNAVVINSILNNKADDTTYLFTLDEETTQYAIRDYMKLFGTEQFVINLDITNEGIKDSHVSIEYDEPSWEICTQIKDNFEKPFFTKDRECDDLDEVMKADGFGFSYCIPSGKNIHSYNNYTYLENIEPYMEGLDFLVHEMCVSEINHNIKHIKIEKALKCSSLKKLVKKDVRKIKKQKPGRNFNHHNSDDGFDRDMSGINSSYSSGHQTSINYYMEGDDDDLIALEDEAYQKKSFAEVVMYAVEETAPVDYHTFRAFVGEKVYMDDLFTKEEAIHYSNERTFSVLSAADLIVRSDENKYSFNIDFFYTNKFKLVELARNKAPKIDFIKFIKFVAEEEDKFSILDLVSMHVDKDSQEEEKYVDLMPFLNDAVRLNLIDKDDKNYYHFFN